MKEVIIYQTKSGSIEFKGDFTKETIWASLQQIADLFETDKSGISRHIRNIYQSGELVQKSTVAKIATVQTEGKRQIKREIEYYNLDLILSVGYRVNSKTATKFRQWATKTIREHSAEILEKDSLTPPALTALTLLVAESDPKEKARMIALILQLLKR